MLKFKSSVLIFLSFFVLFFSAISVLAGGGNIWLEADSGPGMNNNAGQNIRIVRIYISPDLPCKGAEITLKFADPKDGDFINFSSPNYPPYVMQEDRQPYYKNGLVGTTCSTYAKVGSKVVGDRKVDLTVKTSDGKVINAPGFILHMDGKSYGNFKPADPYWDLTVNNQSITPTPSVIPNTYFPTNLILKMTGQTPFDAHKGQFRRVTFEWNGSPGEDVRYTLYSKDSSDKQAGWSTRDDKLTGPTGMMELAAWVDWDVRVNACHVKNPYDCISSPSILVPKLSANPTPTLISNTPVKITPPVVSITATPPSIDSETAQLQQKVDNLQKQLEASQKKQASLEQALNDLINKIKSIFPFFK